MASPKGKEDKNIPSGIVHVYSSFNNTLITITDRKGTRFLGPAAVYVNPRFEKVPCAQLLLKMLAEKPKSRECVLLKFVSSPGAGRESALRAVANSGMKVTLIRDVTPIPHNGCRPPEASR